MAPSCVPVTSRESVTLTFEGVRLLSLPPTNLPASQSHSAFPAPCKEPGRAQRRVPFSGWVLSSPVAQSCREAGQDASADGTGFKRAVAGAVTHHCQMYRQPSGHDPRNNPRENEKAPFCQCLCLRKHESGDLSQALTRWLPRRRWLCEGHRTEVDLPLLPRPRMPCGGISRNLHGNARRTVSRRAVPTCLNPVQREPRPPRTRAFSSRVPDARVLIATQMRSERISRVTLPRLPLSPGHWQGPR